ncbi:serine/threonine-protein kinase [Sorangium sp. So ce269]
MHLGAGSVLIGKYRLERPLSRGGMGSIWVARHLQLGTPVAVKFMDPAYAESPAFRTRFEREARAAAQLRTPHVVQVHDFGFHESVPYLVMELLQGEDLNARLQRRGRLPLLEAHRILAQTGKALRSAHDAGLVHRDLKPANLFLARVDGEDEDMVKLLDFGIATREERCRLRHSGRSLHAGNSPPEPASTRSRRQRGALRRHCTITPRVERDHKSSRHRSEEVRFELQGG